MRKTIIIMAMSGCGKDTAIQYLSSKYNLEISISSTTRPMRDCEVQGREYNFITKEEFDLCECVVPPRVYHTVHGDWYYMTDPNVKGKIVILDFKGAKAVCEVLGRENCYVIKINAPTNTLFCRAMDRGDDIDEIRRRLLDDDIVFEGSDEYADVVINNNSTLDNFKELLDLTMKNGGLI